MIYLDTSVALAQLFAEDRVPPASLWMEPLVSSRLLHYELWRSIHIRRLSGSHGDAARDLLSRVAVVEMTEPVLSRALEPFPSPVRTLDALHLASVAFLREQALNIRLATYDRRLETAAERMRIPLVEL